MKHTREQLDGMGEGETNVLLHCLLLGGDWLNHSDVSDSFKFLCLHDAAGNPYFEDVPDYCNNWNDIMPLAVKYGICVDAKIKMAWIEAAESSGDVLFEYVIESTSPQRAIACCLIMFLESKND